MVKPSTNAVASYLVLSSLFGGISAQTIFQALIPSKCVNPLLNQAGFCIVNNECTNTCFSQASSSGSINASPLSLETEALKDFYIPVDAVECDELSDPICPAVQCCPACRDEIDALYRCLILEADYHYLDFLAKSCPLTCPSRVPPVTATAPPVAATTAPVATTTPNSVNQTSPPVVNTTQSTVNTSNVTMPDDDIETSNVTMPDDDLDFEEEVVPAAPVSHIGPNWVIPFDFQPYPMMTVRVGDSLTFSWTQGTHDVWIYPNSLQSSCDRTGKVQIGTTRDNPTTYVFGENDGGRTITFACDIGSHCEAGMIMDVNVLPRETEEVEQEGVVADVLSNGDLNSQIVIVSTNDGVTITDLHHGTVDNYAP